MCSMLTQNNCGVFSLNCQDIYETEAYVKQIYIRLDKKIKIGYHMLTQIVSLD